MTDRAPRRARVRSEVAGAETVAAAIAPDDTDEIDTRLVDGAVVATIERPTTASLEATLDDYVVALGVATAVVDAAESGTGATSSGTGAARGSSDASDDGSDESSANRHADTH